MAQKTGALIFDETADRYDIRFDIADYPGEVIPARTAERPTPRRKASVAACGRRHAEYTMILPYSHSPSVKSVAGNG